MFTTHKYWLLSSSIIKFTSNFSSSFIILGDQQLIKGFSFFNWLNENLIIGLSLKYESYSPWAIFGWWPSLDVFVEIEWRKWWLDLHFYYPHYISNLDDCWRYWIIDMYKDCHARHKFGISTSCFIKVWPQKGIA